MRIDHGRYFNLVYGFDCDIFAVHMIIMVMITRMIRRLILCMMVMVQIMIEGLIVIIIDLMFFILSSAFIVVGLIQFTSRVVSRTIIVMMVLMLKYRVDGYGGDDDGGTR